MSYNFEELARKAKNPSDRVRFIAMTNIQEGKSLKATSDSVKVHWKTIQSWLRGFRESGLQGLYVKTAPGAKKKLSPDVEKWIVDFLTALNSDTSAGQITGKQLHHIVQERFSASCSLRTIYNTIHSLNFSWISARSIHPKSDLETQEQYKKLRAISEHIGIKRH